jgi:hypothetical protein
VQTTYLAAIPPTIELRLPVSPRLELGLWVPVLNAVPWSGRLFLWSDVFVTVYPTRDRGGFFIAPGAGFVYGRSSEASGTGVQLPVRIGYEFADTVANGRRAGVSVALRPWAELVVPHGPLDMAARYGAFFEVSAVAYFMGAAPSPARR